MQIKLKKTSNLTKCAKFELILQKKKRRRHSFTCFYMKLQVLVRLPPAPLCYAEKSHENKFLMDWMNIGATVLLVIIGIAIYIHKRKGEE